MATIHLQGIGQCEAIKAGDLKVGMMLSWNYSPRGYQCVGVRDRSPAFIEIAERNMKTGNVTVRRLKRSRLVAAEVQ